MKKIVLATDLGGTNLRMAAVSNEGHILTRVKYKTPQSNNPNKIIDAIVNAALECQSGLVDTHVVAIAVAVPGIINFDDGIIIKSPNLPELDGFDFVGAIEKKLNYRAILENDANAAVIGENWLGASVGLSNSIMVTLGTGVGGGIIIDGKVLRGIDGTAGEIGHINVEPRGHICGCGSFGCIEQYSSATAIVRMAKEIAKEKSETLILENRDLTSKDLFQMAQEGNEIAQEVFKKQGYYLGIMLAGLINTLNPEAIVIGGGASAGWDLFIPHLRDQVKIRAYNRPAERARIVSAELGDDAGILGAARLGYAKSFQTTTVS
jgi:glucokinase